MEDSKYQLAVYDHLERMSGNSAVISVAGSGKTTTALKGIGHLPFGTSVLLGAFNVSIRDEFKEKGMKMGYKDVTYANFNGFGWGICLRNLKVKPELDKEKTRNILEFVVMKPFCDEEYKKMWNYYPLVKRMVSLFKNFNLHTMDEVNNRFDDLVNHYNLEIPDNDDFRNIVLDTFWESVNHQSHYDFDDQKYMPLHFGWTIPCYDQVIIDEFQDVCPVELELMLAAGRGGQVCALGDPDQAIYGFKGSTPDVFNDYIKRVQAKELPLSICYRCPISVIKEAQKIVPRIEWAPQARYGTVDSIARKRFLEQVGPHDFVLCRTTDDLVKTQIELTKMRKASKVRGRDFGTALEGLIKKISHDENMPVDDFIKGLINYQIQRAEQLTSLRRENEIITLEDRCNSLRALADNASNTEDIKTNLKNVFSDEPHNGIDLMTIHKSKGLQSPKVWILRRDLLPHPLAQKREWMMQEERRLEYVAITRSEDQLFWVGK